jgi:hypothetical protein
VTDYLSEIAMAAKFVLSVITKPVRIVGKNLIKELLGFS